MEASDSGEEQVKEYKYLTDEYEAQMRSKVADFIKHPEDYEDQNQVKLYEPQKIAVEQSYDSMMEIRFCI